MTLMPSSHFLDSVSFKITPIQKKKSFLEYLYTFQSAVSFALNCLLVFHSAVSVAIRYLYSKAVSVAELGYL